MLLAIDVGNTHTVFGVWDGQEWKAVWRRATDPDATEDELAAWIHSMHILSGIEQNVEQVICASVVPPANDNLERLCESWFHVPITFLRNGASVGLQVDYHPSTSVGADRLANALGALAKYAPPLVVVDFGTGTNFDVVDSAGTYVGGAIMPGILVGSEALFKRAAKLPFVENIELAAPKSAIGKSTVESLQSGIVLGYAEAIDGLVRRIRGELEGEVTVIATGGLGHTFIFLCESIRAFEPNLTLDGLRIASERLG